jgi:hypothetical protein
MNKYRIKEEKGVHTTIYTIEVLTVVCSGFLWWKKRRNVWVKTNSSGRPIPSHGYGSFHLYNPSKLFTTKQEAIEQVHKWLNPAPVPQPIYHYIE